MYTVKQMSIELTFDLKTKSIQYYLYICHSQFRAFHESDNIKKVRVWLQQRF